MSLVELTEFLVKTLVTNKDNVSVKEFDTDEENTVLIQVLVDSEDIGKVIGKGGKIANSIRTIIQALAYTKKLGRVRINIDSL